MEADGNSVTSFEMAEAAEWGNCLIIADLLRYSTPILLGPTHTKSRFLLALCEAGLNAADMTVFQRTIQRMWAIVHGNLEECLTAAIKSSHKEMIEYLVAIDTCYVDKSFLAAVMCDSATAQHLLQTLTQKSPIPPCITTAALRPLMLDFPRAHLILDGLVDLGAVNMTAICDIEEFGYLTPLGLAIMVASRQHDFNLDAVEFWLRKGCNPNDIVRMYCGEVHINETAFLVAIGTGRKDIVQLLMKYGADVNKKPCLGIKQSPLQRAAEMGNVSIAQLLLESGAEANGDSAIRRGGTALQFASASGNCNLAAELLTHGARLDALPSRIYGKWPLEGAAKHGRLDMIQFIWRAADDFITSAPAGIHSFSGVMDIPGFHERQCLRAMNFAMGSGYRGCAELISELSGLSVDLINRDDYGPPWLAYC